MALKKDAKTDESKQTKDVKAKAEVEAATDETKAVAAKEPKEAIGTYIYCGPTVKKYGIAANAIYRGTKADVLKHLGEAIKEYPDIAKLIVSSKELAKSQSMLKTKNNAFYNTYVLVEKKIKEV